MHVEAFIRRREIKVRLTLRTFNIYFLTCEPHLHDIILSPSVTLHVSRTCMHNEDVDLYSQHWFHAARDQFHMHQGGAAEVLP